MNILITGNLGYNGLVVTKFLNNAGYKTIGIDTDYYKSTIQDIEKEFLPSEQIFKDIRDLDYGFLKDIDCIIHLSALSNDALGELNPDLTDQVNNQASVTLAIKAKTYGVKSFIFASSCSVYGIVDPSSYADENSNLDPLTTYAIAKVKTEQSLVKLYDKSFRVVIMRNSTMHGLSPKLRLDLVVNNLSAYAHIYKRVKILSDGTPWRPLISVDDFANIVLLFVKNEAKSIIYNIGFNAENYRIKELGEIISGLANCELEINPSKTPDERNYKVDFSKLHKEFPEIPLLKDIKSSVQELLDAYAQNNLTEEKFTGSNFFRIRTLKSLLEEGCINDQLRWK